MNEPHWEHGLRCHGYWIGLDRIGFVGLPPRFAPAKVHGYGWVFGSGQNPKQGRTKTLRQAKKIIEKLHKESIGKQG